jgi:hypothetical protein
MDAYCEKPYFAVGKSILGGTCFQRGGHDWWYKTEDAHETNFLEH